MLSINVFLAPYETAFLQKLFGKKLKLPETVCTISRYAKRMVPFDQSEASKKYDRLTDSHLDFVNR